MEESFLTRIIETKKREVEAKKKSLAGLKRNVSQVSHSRYGLFKEKISSGGQINLIGEIKKASPSKGLIRADFDVIKIAQAYVDNQVAAISVLTEEKYFLGKPQYVRLVSGHFGVPVLAKDFFIDDIQIYEAFNLGASAILLIVGILDDQQLLRLLKVAGDLDLDCLVEVHDKGELERAIKSGAEIIGINNRDLNTFKVDTANAERLIDFVPKDKVIVVESGIHSSDDVARLRDKGVHAVLIGEAFMRSNDISGKIKEIMGRSI